MSHLTNFTDVIGNGTSFNGTDTPVAGIVGTFGSPEILGIVGILIILIIGIKMKASPDLIIISVITMLEILSGVFLPEWIFWLFILGGGVIFGLGLLKLIKNR
jgi:hypothetical protein